MYISSQHVNIDRRFTGNSIERSISTNDRSSERYVASLRRRVLRSVVRSTHTHARVSETLKD